MPQTYLLPRPQLCWAPQPHLSHPSAHQGPRNGSVPHQRHPTAGTCSSGPAQGIPDLEEVAPDSTHSPRGHLAQLLTTAPVSERLLQRLQSTEPARHPRKAQSQRSHFQRRKLKTPVICAGTQEACSRTSSLLVRSLITNSLSFLIAIHFGTSLIYSPKQLCPL